MLSFFHCPAQMLSSVSNAASTDFALQLIFLTFSSDSLVLSYMLKLQRRNW